MAVSSRSESAGQTNITVLHSADDIDVIYDTDIEIENVFVQQYIKLAMETKN